MSNMAKNNQIPSQKTILHLNRKTFIFNTPSTRQFLFQPIRNRFELAEKKFKVHLCRAGWNPAVHPSRCGNPGTVVNKPFRLVVPVGSLQIPPT
jgi:hypothetical protein